MTEAEHRHISPELLAALTEPGASAPDERRVFSHLAACRHCTAIWAEFVRARTRFSLRADADMPPESLIETANRIPNAPPARRLRDGRLARQRVATALAPLAVAIAFLLVWQAKRHESQPIVDPDQKRGISERLRQDSHGGLLYDGDYLPSRRGTRGSEHDPEGAVLEPLLKAHAGVPTSSEDAWWFVADLLAATRLRHADPYLQESLRRFPADARFHNLAAILAYKHSDLATAERELRTALALERGPAELFNLSVVLQEQGRMSEANDLQVQVLQQFPDSGVARLILTVGGSEREPATP